jgi:hypothetical protein
MGCAALGIERLSRSLPNFETLGGLLAIHDALLPIPGGDEEETFDQYELAMRLISAVQKADEERVLQAGRDADAEEPLQVPQE